MDCGAINEIRIPVFRATQAGRGFAFVEFEEEVNLTIWAENHVQYHLSFHNSKLWAHFSLPSMSKLSVLSGCRLRFCRPSKKTNLFFRKSKLKSPRAVHLFLKIWTKKSKLLLDPFILEIWISDVLRRILRFKPI
jgi:RNA recognition motif-containing protein